MLTLTVEDVPVVDHTLQVEYACLTYAALAFAAVEEGVHSGEAGGVVPSSFRIARMLLDRIEDPATGELLLPELRADLAVYWQRVVVGRENKNGS